MITIMNEKNMHKSIGDYLKMFLNVCATHAHTVPVLSSDNLISE